MTRFAPYGRHEKAIAASDVGSIRQRWEYGRRLLCDPSMTTPDGNLRNGVIAGLIEEAHRLGRKLSEREIRYRIQAARTYPYESQIRHICAGYESWGALRAADFPEVAPEDDTEPFDPRGTAEKARAAEKRHAPGDPGDTAQLELFEYFPDERFNPLTTLAELAKYADESAEWTARHARKDRERTEYLRRLISAVNGDLSKTWEQAQAALDSAA